MPWFVWQFFLLTKGGALGQKRRRRQFIISCIYLEPKRLMRLRLRSTRCISVLRWIVPIARVYAVSEKTSRKLAKKQGFDFKDIQHVIKSDRRASSKIQRFDDGQQRLITLAYRAVDVAGSAIVPRRCPSGIAAVPFLDTSFAFESLLALLRLCSASRI